MNHYYSVACRVYIELHGVSSQLDRFLERFDAVFRQGSVGPAMRDPERTGARVGQGFSGKVTWTGANV